MIETINMQDTYLPVFPGFYNTIFDFEEERCFCDDEDFTNKELAIEHDLIDYSAYHEDVAKACFDTVKQWILEHKLARSIEFVKLYSPEYYNYRNDDVVIKLDSDLDSEQIEERLQELLDPSDGLEIQLYWEALEHIDLGSYVDWERLKQIGDQG